MIIEKNGATKMADSWVELTPAPPNSLQSGYAHSKIQVNLANATSMWRTDKKTTEIWFFAAGDDARRFYVEESPADIVALLRKK